MSAFLIVDTRIENPEVYEEYKKLAKPIAEKYGGRYRARGGEMEVRETDLWTPTRMVVIEFPDMASARAFVDSAEYAPVKPLRRDNAQCTLFILDGD
ncbi:MAG: hypothetical protein [Olavius algarvensis Gamma 3 endosymbiont]|nr:MAG: hypothetical protein [Olavius algarvensis Gamma 3 endosymbiont]